MYALEKKIIIELSNNLNNLFVKSSPRSHTNAFHFESTNNH